jgi:lipid A oxidase
MKCLLAFCIAVLAVPSSSFAQVELSFYTGVQSAQPSDVSIRDPLLLPVNTRMDWRGRSFDAPLYYGLRATSWRSGSFGVGLDFAHNKIYPSSLPDGYDVLEMTDGLNTLTVNAYRRWDSVIGNLVPYVGGGIGIAVPHVEVINDMSQTSGYQLTGPAATLIAGASLPLNDQWSVFGEYKGTYSANTAELDSGGTLEADIVTNALNFGVSFNF